MTVRVRRRYDCVFTESFTGSQNGARLSLGIREMSHVRRGSVVPGRMEARAISDALKGLGFVNTGGASRVSVVIACVTGGWSVSREGEVCNTPKQWRGTWFYQCESVGERGHAAMLEQVG